MVTEITCQSRPLFERNCPTLPRPKKGFEPANCPSLEGRLVERPTELLKHPIHVFVHIGAVGGGIPVPLHLVREVMPQMALWCLVIQLANNAKVPAHHGVELLESKLLKGLTRVHE